MDMVLSFTSTTPLLVWTVNRDRKIVIALLPLAVIITSKADLKQIRIRGLASHAIVR